MANRREKIIKQRKARKVETNQSIVIVKYPVLTSCITMLEGKEKKEIKIITESKAKIGRLKKINLILTSFAALKKKIQNKEGKESQ